MKTELQIKSEIEKLKRKILIQNHKFNFSNRMLTIQINTLGWVLE